MTNKFKAGDKVVRIEPYYGFETTFMQKGGVYTVSRYYEGKLILEGNNSWFSETNFDLVQPTKEKEMINKFNVTNKFAVGDKVKKIDSYEQGVVIFVSDDGKGIRLDGRCGFHFTKHWELAEPQFKNMKFRVNSPEHSKEIQEALFEMGYKWYGQEVAEMIDSEYSFMYSYEDGTITHSHKHYMSMENTHSQEYTVETTKSYKLIPVESPKETITIDGKTYDKEAVLKRLAELEEVK